MNTVRSCRPQITKLQITKLQNSMNGVVVIDKPGGLTSHDVVNRVRRILGQRSVGHLGTLDPLATGVLPIVLGNLTRLAQFYAHSEKTYEGAIRFGFSTDTYDADGEPTTSPKEVNFDCDVLREAVAQFQGSIEQMPPPFSAKKVAGVPAYKLARKKQEVALSPVQVEIKEFGILEATGDRATFRARVSSGTYIRSVAHELGRKLGCGAHLASLRRTAVAEFTIEAAHSLEVLEAAMQQGSAALLFVHSRKLVPQFPCVTANEESAARIRSGRSVNLPEMSRAPKVKVFCGQDDLIAIATRIAGTLFHPQIVLSGSGD
ncbi:MAG: tRNA pseudouridine(55) synthase TruB [Terriglobales bacterium]|jgi:tRNA pseudouridine55 synthase